MKWNCKEQYGLHAGGPTPIFFMTLEVREFSIKIQQQNPSGKETYTWIHFRKFWDSTWVVCRTFLRKVSNWKLKKKTIIVLETSVPSLTLIHRNLQMNNNKCIFKQLETWYLWSYLNHSTSVVMITFQRIINFWMSQLDFPQFRLYSGFWQQCISIFRFSLCVVLHNDTQTLLHS